MFCKERACLRYTRKKSHEQQNMHSFLISIACVMDRVIKVCCARRNGFPEPQEIDHMHHAFCISVTIVKMCPHKRYLARKLFFPCPSSQNHMHGNACVHAHTRGCAPALHAFISVQTHHVSRGNVSHACVGTCAHMNAHLHRLHQ